MPSRPLLSNLRESNLPTTPSGAPQETLDLRIARVISDLTGVAVQDLGPHTRIREDLNADSMQILALMIALDAEFDVEFDISRIPDEGVTVEWIRQFVETTLASAA